MSSIVNQPLFWRLTWIIPAIITFCNIFSAKIWLVNAVISYYASLAESCHIKTDFKVIVPQKISISDVDLSLLFGNLLENAIHACCQVPVENQYIHLSSDLNSPSTIYITMVNSFNGM